MIVHQRVHFWNFRLKKGRSKKAHLLCEAVHQATQNFIAKGEDIANENAEVRNEMVAAVDDVRKNGKLLIVSLIAKSMHKYYRISAAIHRLIYFKIFNRHLNLTINS